MHVRRNGKSKVWREKRKNKNELRKEARFSYVIVGLLRVRYGINACLFFVFAQSFIPNNAVDKREKGVVFADTYVCAGVDFRTTLTNENVPCEHCLTVATLRAKSFRFAVSTVVGRAGTFFMSE